MTKGKGSSKFYIDKLMKQSWPGKWQPGVVTPAYAGDRRLCVWTVLHEYVLRTEGLRKSDQLLVSYVRQHY